MNFIVLGYRNLLRNARRSLAVVMTIAIGFAAVTLFAGYMKMVYRGLADQAIYGELIGHLTISKRGMATEGRLHPEKYLLTKDEIARITNAIRAAEAEWFIASRLALSGILSNGRASTVFIAEGVNPADMQVLRGPRVMASGALKVDQTNGVTLADGLAGVLGLHEGDDAAVLVSTIYGQANASDVSIIDVFSTGNAGTSDKFMFIPLSLARLLSDADERADRLTLIQREGTPDEERRQKLADTLNATGLDLEVRSWEEMSGFYRHVKSMFDMIFGFLLAIVLTIVVMSVANSMSMGVIERTREIGTLRAIGMRRHLVVRLFSAEAALLVFAGCLLGLAIALSARYLVNAAEIHYLPPNSTDPVLLLIGIDLPRTIVAGIALTLLGVAAASLPAVRAARRPITVSLSHV